MFIDSRDASLIQSSRHLFAMTGEAVTAAFYDRLFEIAPEVRRLFPADMAGMRRKLASTLALASGAIGDAATLRPVLEDLARRHVGYGVEPQHYGAVAAALLDTLCAADAPPDLVAAWGRALDEIARVMIAAAEGTNGARADEWRRIA